MVKNLYFFKRKMHSIARTRGTTALRAPHGRRFTTCLLLLTETVEGAMVCEDNDQTTIATMREGGPERNKEAALSHYHGLNDGRGPQDQPGLASGSIVASGGAGRNERHGLFTVRPHRRGIPNRPVRMVEAREIPAPCGFRGRSFVFGRSQDNRNRPGSLLPGEAAYPLNAIFEVWKPKQASASRLFHLRFKGPLRA